MHAIAANSAWQLVPMISQISAYCRFVSPPPTTLWSTPATAAESTGRKRFHRPCAFACARVGVRVRVGGQGLGPGEPRALRLRLSLERQRMHGVCVAEHAKRPRVVGAPLEGGEQG